MLLIRKIACDDDTHWPCLALMQFWSHFITHFIDALPHLERIFLKQTYCFLGGFYIPKLQF